MKQFEYAYAVIQMTVDTPVRVKDKSYTKDGVNDLAEMLTRIGADGWQVVDILNTNNYLVSIVLLMREVSQ
jgi:hypothetical protein